MQQSQANQLIHLLLPIVKESLADCNEIPARNQEDFSLDTDEAGLFFHDGTERPIPRSTDYETQKAYYSGKKNSIR